VTSALPDDLAAAIVEGAPDGIVVVDPDGRIVSANPRAEALFGHPAGSLTGTSVDDLLPSALRAAHERHRAHFVADPHTRPMGIGLTLHGTRRDGSTFPVEIALSPLRSPEGLRVVAIVRDVTDREQAEARLRTTQHDLAIVAERERIARELHDTVIQHLFAVGITLQALEARIDDHEVAERLHWATDRLDAIVEDVRGAIFGRGNLSFDDAPGRSVGP
jgi:PAS domain S-box-containing protein